MINFIKMMFVFIAVLSSSAVVEPNYKYQWNPLTNSMQLLPVNKRAIYDFATNDYVYVKR